MKQFNIAIVGCGSMSTAWVEYALSRKDCKICAIVDINIDSANSMKAKYSLDCPTYTDLQKAIRENDINLVMDITIPQAHFQVLKTALSSGCDCLGEKPMADGIESAREMCRLTKSAGKTYAVMQNRRYLKNIRAYKELLQPEVLGNIGIINAEFYIGAHFGGFRDAMESPLILDMAIHTFDQARFLSGGSPVSVYCHEFNPSWSWYAGNAAATCIFEFDNGAVFTYNGAWCSEGCMTPWECYWRTVGSQGSAIWHGDEIYAEILNPDAPKSFTSETIRVEPKYLWQGNENHTGCLDEMFNALIENRNPETICFDNIKSMEMVFAAIESAKQCKKILI